MQILALVALLSALVDARPAEVAPPPPHSLPTVASQPSAAPTFTTISNSMVVTHAARPVAVVPPGLVDSIKAAIPQSQSGTPASAVQLTNGPKTVAKAKQTLAVNKPSLTSDAGWKTSMGPKLRESLPPAKYTMLPWKWDKDWIPSVCYSMAKKGDYKNEAAYSPMDVEVFGVRYDDCPVEWLMCRHKGAGVSKKQMAETFGRLPVVPRSMIRHIAAFPSKHNASWAYNKNDDIAFLGPQSDDRFLTVWIHELGHTLDRRISTEPGKRIAHTAKWTEAVARDTAVVSKYAQTSVTENFADEFAAAFYDRFVPGGLRTFFKNNGGQRIANQVKVIKDALEPYIANKNAVCGKRVRHDKVVRKNGGATRRSREEPPPDLSLGPEVEAWDSIDDDEIHECTCGHHH